MTLQTGAQTITTNIRQISQKVKVWFVKRIQDEKYFSKFYKTKWLAS